MLILGLLLSTFVVILFMINNYLRNTFYHFSSVFGLLELIFCGYVKGFNKFKNKIK